MEPSGKAKIIPSEVSRTPSQYKNREMLYDYQGDIYQVDVGIYRQLYGLQQ